MKIRFTKLLLILGISVILNLIISGCSGVQPEPKVITEIRYVDKVCPVPKAVPSFQEYNVMIMEIDSEIYYVLPKSEAVKLVQNWNSYKNWSETNYELMNSNK